MSAAAIAAASESAVALARAAQQSWRTTTLRRRLQIVRATRLQIARNPANLLQHLADTSGRRAEKLVAEILPLCEAARFLEDEAAKILKPLLIRLKHRPLWLRDVEVKQHRDPLGVVLIVGPRNYPLFLPAAQALQALVAGNAVLIKPGTGGASVMRAFAEVARRAGVPVGVLHVLDEPPHAAVSAIDEQVDKIFLTGSFETGQNVYRLAASHLTPVVLELSGADPVFIFRGANLRRAVAAIAFGRRWNGGDTCIAPRRIFVQKSVAAEFLQLLQSAVFEPLPVASFDTDREAVQLAEQSRFALGASIFAEEKQARRFASMINAGVVTINDLIAPTAHPGVAFGGRGDSGFGSTRGAEGLLQMTNLRTVIAQMASRLRHLEALPENAEQLFTQYLQTSHAAGPVSRFRSLAGLAKSVARAKRVKK